MIICLPGVQVRGRMVIYYMPYSYLTDAQQASDFWVIQTVAD